MPRSDKTFTGIDLCRFWMFNLDKEEQKDVFVFFIVAFAINTGNSITKKSLLLVLGVLVRFAPGPWRLVLKLILRLFKVQDVTQEALEFYERAQRIASEIDITIEDVADVVLDLE